MENFLKIMNKTALSEVLFESATIGILIADQQGEIVLANKYVDKIFGYEHHALIGQKVEVLLPESLRYRHEHHRQSYHAHPKERAMGIGLDLFAQHQDGTIFPVEVSLGYFKHQDQTFVLAFVIDVTEKKAIEQEIVRQKNALDDLNANLEEEIQSRTSVLKRTLADLAQSKRDLELALSKEKELSELKSRFVSMASHEFRTPLSSILSSITLIQKYTQTSEQDKREKHIERIISSVQNLNHILEEFLSVGRLEEGKIEYRPAEFDWIDLFNQVISEVQHAAKPGQRIYFLPQGLPTIQSDSALLRRIMINLLSNALKFSGDGSIVRVWGERTRNLLRITVQDQGIGISEADQKHLFERFFRSENALNIQGTGLGLHIVAKFVEIMQGRIQLDSELGRGTKITIEIPNTY